MRAPAACGGRAHLDSFADYRAIESRFQPQPSRRVTAPLVGKKGKPAAGSPDRENPYDVLFA